MPTNTVFSTFEKINFVAILQVSGLCLLQFDRLTQKFMAQNTSTNRFYQKVRKGKNADTLHTARFSITYLKLFRGPLVNQDIYIYINIYTETLRIAHLYGGPLAF